MKTWENQGGDSFQYHQDRYGILDLGKDVIIKNQEGDELQISAAALLEFFADAYTRRRLAHQLEIATAEELMLGRAFDRKRGAQ